MKIIVNAFSSVKALCGFAEKQIELAEKATVEDALKILFDEFDSLTKFKNKLFYAVNEEYCNEDKILQDGDQLAIFPPVSGG